MPRLPQVERCPTGHLPPDHNHNNRGAAGSRQDSHNDHGNTKYDGPQNNSAFPSLSKASEGDAAAGGAMKRGSPPANHSSYHTSSRENISLPAANNTRLRPTPPPLDSNKAHKGHHHHHTSQEKITEQHDSEQRRAERRRQNRRSRASVISEYDRLSRHHHREFLRLCGKLPPRGASGKSTTSTTAPAIANGATPTSRAEEDASPCSLGPSQTTSQATGEGGTSEWLIEATGSASDFIGSNQKPVLVFGIGTYGIAAQEAERKRRLEREQEFAQAKQLHQGTTGQQVEEPSATRSVTSTQPPPSDEAKTKQHKHRKMSVFSRLRKRKPHGFTASSMAEATLKRGSTQTGGGWLDRVHHTASGEEAKGGPTHLPTIDSPKPRRSSTALGDAPEEDEEEEDTFAGTVGGVMDVFGYFSTHRVHPTYYKDLDVLAERGRSPGGSISNGTLTGGFSGTARRRGGGGAGGGGSNAPTDGSLHYFSDTLNNTHGRSPAAGATLAPLAKPRPPPRAPQGGKNSANGGARLPPAPPQCSSGSSLQGITPKKGTPSTNSSSGVGLGHVILMTEPKHNRM